MKKLSFEWKIATLVMNTDDKLSKFIPLYLKSHNAKGGDGLYQLVC